MLNNTNYYTMKSNDLNYGLEKEEVIKNTIENFFNVKLKKPKNKFSRYDYKSKGVRYEIKSRKFKSDLYDTTFLCKSKIDYYNKIKGKKKFILIFNFTDKIKYIEFTDDLLKLPIQKVKIYRGEEVENIKIPIGALLDLVN
jgi:hypothetical protein